MKLTFYEGNIGITIIRPVKNHGDLISDSDRIPSQLCQKGVEVLGVSLKTCSLKHTILIARTNFEF